MAWGKEFATPSRMVSRILLLLALLLASPVQALANEIEGAWALRIGDANIFIFEIEQTEASEWRGVWTRPERFASNGVVFAQMEGSEQLTAMAALEFAGFVELSFDDPRPGAVPDIFRIRVTGENQAELIYIGTDFEPYPLVRVPPGTDLGPFDSTMIYDRDNAVLQADYISPVAVEETAEPQATNEIVEGDEGEPNEAAHAGDEESEGEEPSRLSADFLEGID